MKLLRSLAVLLVMACGGTAHAFCFPAASDNQAAPGEYYDAASDRYYLAWSSATSVGVCFPPFISQLAPEGTTRTGLGWTTIAHAYACPSAPNFPPCSAVRQVCEFESRGSPAPASRFYTIDAEECEALKRPDSGWTYLPMTSGTQIGGPSLSAFSVNPSTGKCIGDLVPVYRFLKTSGRGPLNHRFVADTQVVEQMRTRAGWTFERIAFCVLGAQRDPLGTPALSFQFIEGIGPLAPCDNGVGRINTCIESDNLPALRDVRQAGPDSVFGNRTGAIYSSGYVHALPFPTAEEAAGHSYAQTTGLAPGAGFFVTSRDRSAAGAVSVRGRTRVADVQMPPPFLAAYEVEMDLLLQYRLFVKHARVTGDGAGAYVQPLVTLRDSRSGLAMELSPGAIGTPDMGDGTFRDAATGDVLVFIALGPSTSIGRSFGLPALQIPKTFDAANPWGMGGDFEYRVNRSEFVRALQRARALEPRLSADPGDYRVDALSLKGEVAGDSEIGYQVERFELSVVRP